MTIQSRQSNSLQKSLVLACGAVLLAMGFAPVGSLRAQESEFKAIFDGKSLEGWDGKSDFWSVQDGALTGTTTKEKPTSGNTFIIWKGGELKDFHLKLKFRIDGGNSGIQFRSTDHKNHVVGGYQADFDSGNGWTGSLYEERGRGILAKRGNAVKIAADGSRKESAGAVTEKEILESVKAKDWNDYEVIVQGGHIVLKVNGKVSVDLEDSHEGKAAASGILALQLHAGPPMVVQFKDIQLKQGK